MPAGNSSNLTIKDISRILVIVLLIVILGIIIHSILAENLQIAAMQSELKSLQAQDGSYKSAIYNLNNALTNANAQIHSQQLQIAELNATLQAKTNSSFSSCLFIPLNQGALSYLATVNSTQYYLILDYNGSGYPVGLLQCSIP